MGIGFPSPFKLRKDLGRFQSVDEVIEQAVYALREKSTATPAPPRKPRKNPADFLLESPFAGSELDLERPQDYGRPVDFVSGFLGNGNRFHRLLIV